MGTSADKGQFIDTLISTGAFLYEQKRLPKAPSREIFESFLKPEYLETVTK